MSRAQIALDHLSPAQKQELKRLTSAPPVAWPTVILFLILVSTFLTVYAVCGLGWVPLWIGTVINTVVGYVAFSVAHDSLHRAVSTHTRFNDAIGQVGLMVVLPYVDTRMFRWAHILHHRFASGDGDPDIVFRGAWWSLPFRWMFIDIAYFIHALKHADRISKPYLRSSLWMFAGVAALFTALIVMGYGVELFMLWFVPSRLVMLMLGFSFFWLPHVPHDVSQAENFTRATTVRFGWEWLLGPALQYQNYHLIHHLYPMTPFYNNYKVWKLLEPALMKQDLAIQHNFAIHPEIRLHAGSR